MWLSATEHISSSDIPGAKVEKSGVVTRQDTQSRVT